MKHNYAGLIGLLIVLTMILSGCNLIGEDQGRVLDQQIADATSKNARVVVNYDGGTITRGDVYLAYNNELNELYNMYGQMIEAGYYDPAQIISFVQEDTLNAAVKDVAVTKIFEDRGMTVEDEKLAEIDEEVEEHYQEMWDAAYASADGKTADIKTKQAELTLAQLGYTKQMLSAGHLAETKAELLEEAVKAEVTEADITDDMVEATYNEKVEADKSSYSSSVYSFESAAVNGTDIYWYPEGYRRVKHILVKVDDALINAVVDARQAVDTAESDLEALQQELEAAQNPASDEEKAVEQTNEAAEEAANARSVEEINADIEVAQAGLEGLRADVEAAEAACLAAAQDKLDEIYGKIEAGVNFDDLMAEYGEDPGMQKEPAMTEGYYVSDASVLWDSAFTAGAMALENIGDVSAAPVISGSGLHIIRYESDVTSGAVALEDVREKLFDETLEDQKEERYQNLLDETVAALNPQFDYSALSAE